MPAPGWSARSTDDDRVWAEHERRERERNWDRKPYDALRSAACFSTRRPTPDQRAAIRPRVLPEEVRQQSGTTGARLASSCAGWAEPPTAAEFYAAIRADQPTERPRPPTRRRSPPRTRRMRELGGRPEYYQRLRMYRCASETRAWISGRTQSSPPAVRRGWRSRAERRPYSRTCRYCRARSPAPSAT